MDVALLKETWQQVAAHGDDVPMSFYSRLFLAHPETRSMFPASMAGQRDRLVRALGRIVTDADDISRLAPFLVQLGHDHAMKYGIRSRHYPWVGEALLETLAFFLGDRWTKQVRDVWTQAYATVSKKMMEGASTASPSLLGRDTLSERSSATPLTPEGIRETRFPRGRWRDRGYRRQEVDAFVSLVVGELEQRIDDQLQLRSQVDVLQARVEELQQYYRARNSDLERSKPE